MTNRRPLPMESFYADPAQAKKWGEELVGQGLWPTESHLISKYFKPDWTLLNIGCGGGREALALAENFKLTALDNQAEFCRCCTDALSAADLPGQVLQMDATALAFEDGSFDCAIMVGQLIGHIRPRAKRITALTELRRVLKPGAVALVSTNAIERSWKYRIYFALVNTLRKSHNPQGLEPDDAYVRKSSSGAVFHWYRTGEFLKDAKAAGFECLEMLRRFQFEKGCGNIDPSTSGETYYVLKR